MNRLAVAVCLVLLAIVPAPAATIVDTGAGYPGLAGYTLASGQWAAGKFELPAAYTITDVFGWVYVVSGSTGTVTIYDDAGTKPGSEIFSTPFDTVPDVSSAGWAGASGLGWALGPGSYWVAYEVRTGQDFLGTMPALTAGTPLSEYVLGKSPTWVSYPVNAGVRILGTSATPVPEPTTFGLVAAGLAAVAGLRRRRPKVS